MLQRDRYQPDHCMIHYPLATLEEYTNYMMGPSGFRRLFTNNKDFHRQYEFTDKVIVGVFTLSLLPIFLHKKIYWFRNITSTKSRVFMGLGFALIPSNIVGGFMHNDLNKELTMKYELNRELFQRMLQQGDINVTNPYQEWSDY